MPSGRRLTPSAYRRRPIAVGHQLQPQLVEHPGHAIGLDLGDRLAVDAGGTAVFADLLPGPREDIGPSDPVVQGMEAPLR
jgi:hypothetical protein